MRALATVPGLGHVSRTNAKHAEVYGSRWELARKCHSPDELPQWAHNSPSFHQNYQACLLLLQGARRTCQGRKSEGQCFWREDQETEKSTREGQLKTGCSLAWECSLQLPSDTKWRREASSSQLLILRPNRADWRRRDGIASQVIGAAERGYGKDRTSACRNFQHPIQYHQR